MRKEIAWLRRGPARAHVQAEVPHRRGQGADRRRAARHGTRVELVKFATARLGKTVYDLERRHLARRWSGQGPLVLDRCTWQFGPGDRVGLVGVNGSGKSSVLRLLAGSVAPDSGRLVQGKTVRLAHLSQELAELDPARACSRRSRRSASSSRSASASGPPRSCSNGSASRGDAQWKVVGDLSGGERRRLQLLRLLMDDPNVLLLDEPTNDLDIETLNELEDLLDAWPGTLILVSHDRYFLERVTDRCVALLGDGRAVAAAGWRRRVSPAPVGRRGADRPRRFRWRVGRSRRVTRCGGPGVR